MKAVRTGEPLVSPNNGPVAQLGARFHGMEEVVGSIPTRSTNLLPSIHAGFLHISTFQNLLSSGTCHKVVTNRMCTDFGARLVSGWEFGLLRAGGAHTVTLEILRL